MKIRLSELKRIIREEIGDQLSLPGVHGSEPLAGDDARNPNSDFWKAVRTPEAVEAFKAAGFTSDGKMADPRKGLGVLEMGMFTPHSQQEVEAAILAALEINAAMHVANQAMKDRKYRYSNKAFYKIVEPVQTKHSRTGASDSDGREMVGNWFDDRGWEWE